MKMTLLLLILAPFLAGAQMAPAAYAPSKPYALTLAHAAGYAPAAPLPRKLYQRNRGMILGLQRGKSTALELGAEAHWRKLALRKPTILGATANMEYNFADHVIGYKAGIWQKTGRVNLTYGANLVYYNDFKGASRYGIGPAIGFRLAGFHFVNGYNFLTGTQTADKVPVLDEVNTLYVSLRYYFPMENKFTWDRKTMKKKEKKKKERAKRKKERAKEKEQAEKEGKKTFLGITLPDLKKKSEKEEH